jgi:hypothetical protein
MVPSAVGRATALVVVLGSLSLGCIKSEPKPEAPSPAASEPPLDSIAVVEDPPRPDAEDPEKPSDLSGTPEEVGQRLADEWCASGGAEFRGPGPASNGDDRIALESCGDILVTIVDRQVSGATDAIVIEIDAVFETRDLLFVRHEDGTTVTELDHTLADQSGEIDEPTRSYATTELRDVVGDDAPEWIATVHEAGGDNYEADRCYAHEIDIRTLLVCRAAGPGGCFALPFRALEIDTPRPRQSLDECDERPEDLTPKHVSGYDQRLEVRRGEVELSRQSATAIDEREEPRRAGVVSMDVLFREEALPARAED